VWEMVWGTISSLGAFAEGVGKVLNYPLLGLYEFMVLPGRKTNQKVKSRFGISTTSTDSYVKSQV